MGFEIIVRNRGRRESLFILTLAGVLGLVPALTYFSTPDTTLFTLVIGALLGIPLFLLSVWRLLHMDALALSADGTTLIFIQRSLRRTRRTEFAVSELRSIGMAAHYVGIHMKSGQSLQFEVEIPRFAEQSLAKLAERLGVPFGSVPADD